MKHKQIQSIHLHFVPLPDGDLVTSRINAFHVKVIERRLCGSELTAREKMQVLEHIIDDMRRQIEAGIRL